MSTAPIIEPTGVEQEILADPAVQAALAKLEDPEDREDLIDGLVALRRAELGLEEAVPWEEALKSEGRM